MRAQESEQPTARQVKLPGEVDDVIVGARGSALLLRMEKLGKVAVFDVAGEKITDYIPLGGNDTLVVATADAVILIARDKKIIQRWTLGPLKKGLTVALPLTEEIDGLAAGYAGNALVLVMTRQGPRFLHPVTLKLVPMENPVGGHDWWRPHPQSPIRVAASADGSTFAGWVPGSSPSGIRTLRLEGNKSISKYEHDSAGAQIPSADGSLLFTGLGVYSADLKPLDPDQRSRHQTFPTLHPAYYISVSRESVGGQNREPAVSIHNTSERAVLMTFDKLPGLGSVDPFGREGLALSKRIIAHPAARKLIVVDEQRTLLHILPLDIVAALEAKGIDYLFVESLPFTNATPGKPYEYAIKTMSKAGNVKYNLDSGPEGMTISPQGVLRWNVPKAFEEDKTSVIVTIEDGSGQSIFHAYSIAVDRPQAR